MHLLPCTACKPAVLLLHCAANGSDCRAPDELPQGAETLHLQPQAHQAAASSTKMRPMSLGLSRRSSMVALPRGLASARKPARPSGGPRPGGLSGEARCVWSTPAAPQPCCAPGRKLGERRGSQGGVQDAPLGRFLLVLRWSSRCVPLPEGGRPGQGDASMAPLHGYASRLTLNKFFDATLISHQA